MTARGTHSLALLGILLAIGALAPAGALAEVRCVHAPGAACDSSHATIGGAVAAAGSSDTVLIGPGQYLASITTSKRLRFEGAGAAATTIKSFNGPALRLRGGGTVASLAARGGGSGDHGAAAILIDPAAAGKLAFHVNDVDARGGKEGVAQGSPGSGLTVTAAFNERPTVFVDGGTFRPGAGGGWVAAMSFAGEATRAELDGVLALGLEGSGIRATGDAELEMTRTAASGTVGASLWDGDYVVRRSRLTGSLCGMCAYDDDGQHTSTVLLENSLVTVSARPADDARGLAAAAGPGRNVSVTARGSTIVAGGDDPDAAVVADDPTGVGTAKVALVGSIAWLQGPRQPGEADLVANREQITASRSSFTTRAISNGGSVTEPGTAGNVGAPLLAADYSLQPGSPAVDSGDPTLAGLDLAGGSRSQDGNADGVAAPDMGAFERGTSAAVPPAQNLAPVVSRFRMTRKILKPKRRTTRFRFHLSERARVEIRIERLVRKKGHKSRFVRVRTLRSAEDAGNQSIRYRSRKRPGRYRARLKATDDQGASTSPKRLRFRFARPR
jgi:hypothetical protein